MRELNHEALNVFCTAWLRKVDRIDTMPLEGVFDKFFTLWVVFNRLYEEAARILVHSGHPLYRHFIIRRGNKVFLPPPDKISATRGITAFIGKKRLGACIFLNADALRGLNYITESIRSGMFYLHENYETGEPDTEKDIALVSRAIDGCVESTLVLIYQARCNLFHGQKAFTESQRELLNGMSTILNEVIECSMQVISEHVVAKQGGLYDFKL